MTKSDIPAATPELAGTTAREARWWRREDDGRIECTLCPRFCRMSEGQAGFCFIRQHVGGRLITLGYGRPAALYADPIEKKPLNHFLPGTMILSMGTAGCNLGCRFCQNWDISKARFDQVGSKELAPDEVPRLAIAQGCDAVAFTYNDPTIYAEYVIDAARECRKLGVATVMVTAGYICREPLDEVYPWIDAANVDLKAFTEEFYRRQTYSHLQPVLDAIVRMREHGTWVELTTLLIPGHNDSDKEIGEECDWILGALGPDVPLRFTAFHPDFKMTDVPATPALTLFRARQIARDKGLRYVYCGNVRDEDSHTTFCPSCGRALIVRDWHAVTRNELVGSGRCSCGHVIPGRFDGASRRRSDGRRRSLLTYP
jgi:pyruvate formate lyase activating enzyme